MKEKKERKKLRQKWTKKENKGVNRGKNKETKILSSLNTGTSSTRYSKCPPVAS